MLARVFIVVVVAALSAGCVSSGSVTVVGQDAAVGVRVAPGDYYDSGSFPPEYMPPPGKCRIWFSRTPPEQQPPPGDCHELQQQVPPGAHLIRGRLINK